MNKIQIISASAGSGKTYRLCQVLEEKIRNKEIRPNAIIATTYTRKAATELQERVRTRLLKAGLCEQAERLAASHIGTVNAVCGKLVRDFAFELGLSPEIQVMDEAPAARALNRALSSVLNGAEETIFADIRSRIPKLDFRDPVKSILDVARSNNIGVEKLRESARRSLEEYGALLGVPIGNSTELLNVLNQALHSFITAVESGQDTTVGTQGALSLAKDALRRIEGNELFPWSDWAKLSKLKPTNASLKLADPVRVAAAAFDRHPQFHADVSQIIGCVFDLAARALEAYRQYKREWRLIDFADQECYALQLLAREDVRQRLSDDIDLVLVDEFQDTSPIQLAIFLQLASIARESVWVGDQKQSIYKFRGTDPTLMDAAIEGILGGSNPESLSDSWRSRPELVRLTSELFVRSFEDQGMPEERVRLQPSGKMVEQEDLTLGPVLERWNLIPNKAKKHVPSLASAIRQFLSDPKSMVRDRETGQLRHVREGDLAVLCLRNSGCASVAEELERIGVKAYRRRTGLRNTVEATLALTGLKYWVDPRDSIAAATIARFLPFAGKDDEWLQNVLEQPHAKAFSDEEVLSRIRTAREANPTASPLAALDAVIDALELNEICLEWGDSAQRLGNLDALRAQALAYADECIEEGRGCTPAGFISFFKSLEDDHQAQSNGDDAVTVSTLHGAKGLEWPVVVLFNQSAFRGGSAFGVSVASDHEKINLSDPLAGRWIRFWPDPLAPQQTGTAFHERVQSSAAQQQAMALEASQSARLLYVGWTRARDRVVLADKPGDLAKGMLSGLRHGGVKLIRDLNDAANGSWDLWNGNEHLWATREATAADPVQTSAKPDEGYVTAGPKDYPPARILPSSLKEYGKTGEPIRIGEPIALSGHPDMNSMGEAIHGFLAVDRPGLSDEQRQTIAQGLLERWGVASSLDAGSLLNASNNLRVWVETNHPNATWRRELPIVHRQASGSDIVGSIDQALDTANGFIVIDHKSYPGSVAQALDEVRKYSGQLAAYSEALKAATDRGVFKVFVHLPVRGILVPLEPTHP